MNEPMLRSAAPSSRSGRRPRRLRTIRLRSQDGVYRADDIDGVVSLWREPYRLMLSVRWPLFLLLIGGAYLGINLIFATLFFCAREGIGGVTEGRPATFADAFFFSVQTLGSIGYGVLHPRSLPVNLLVTMEAFVSLIFTAVTTGLVFARFARSKAEIRFTDVATIQPWNGLPCLTFRMANVHNNSIVDGRLHVYLGLDERSLEGQRLRRMIPLTLVRNQSLHFRLMWTVMHLIDDTSPLAGLSPQELQRRHAEIMVAFHGTDETVRSPVFARTSYAATMLRPDESFEDIVVERGHDLCIDYDRFNRTHPRSGAGAATPAPDGTVV